MEKTRIIRAPEKSPELSTRVRDTHSLDLVAEENHVRKVRIMKMPEKS